MNGYDHWLTQGSQPTHTRDDLEREAEARADEDYHRLVTERDDERDRLPGLRAAADICGAMCSATRHESMMGPVVTAEGAGMGAAERAIRKRIADIEATPPPSYEGCLWHARRNMGLEEE